MQNRRHFTAAGSFLSAELILERLANGMSLADIDESWSGDHAAWSELAIYAANCATKPIVLNRRDDLEWL